MRVTASFALLADRSAATVPVVALSVEVVRGDPKLVKRAVILAGLLGGLQTADPVVASLALPRAGKALGMTATTLALAASISTLFLAATVVLIGAVGDRIGRRKMMQLTTLGTIVGDLIVFVAPTSAVFMLGRAVAGMCVGGLLATAYPYVRTLSSADRLGANLGLWGGLCGGVALPLSIVSSGLASLNWRLAFLCVPAAALACLPFERKVFPKLAPTPVKKQLYGVSLAGLGVVGLLFGLSQAANKVVSPETVLPVAVGLVLVVAAAIVGLRSSRPAYPVRIFRSPVFLTAAISGALWNLAMGISQLQSSNVWQYADGAAPFTAALLQIPLTITFIAGSFLLGRALTKGRGAREIIAGGCVIIAVGFVIMSATGASAMGVAFNCGLMLLGFGTGAIGVAQSKILVTEAPPEYVGPIAASRTTFGQIGYAVGLAGSSVLTTVLTIQALGTPNARADLDTFLTANSAQRAANPALETVHNLVAPFYVDGFKTSLIWWAGVFVVGAIACFALMSVRPHPLQGATAPPK